MRILACLITIFMFAPTQAQASYYIECAVHAQVKRNLETGLYRAEIKGAKVTEGHDQKGAACMKESIDKVLNIKIKGNPPEGKTVRLKYSKKEGNTADGIVTTEIWSYWPPGIKDVLPW